MSDKIWSVPELKLWLKNHNLDVKGKKAELYNRMIDYQAESIKDVEPEEEIILKLPLPTIIEEEEPVEKKRKNVSRRKAVGKLHKKIVDLDSI